MSGSDQLQAKRKKNFDRELANSKNIPVDEAVFIDWILKTLKIQVRYNTILQRQEFHSGAGWRPWTDEQDLLWHRIRSEFEHKDFQNEKLISQAITKEAYRNKVNPIKEYLASCPHDWTTWTLDNTLLIDGLPPSPGLLIAEYIDSPMDKKTIAEIFNSWLVGCAMHGYEPENNDWAGSTICPILTGPQGCNKSRFTAWIGQAAGREYYNESIIDADNKDNRIALATTWIWAADEFSGTMIKSKSETIKNFLSRKSITERLPFGKRPQTMPRVASLIGTDNEPRPLRDTTGNRRFAVIPITRVRLEEMQAMLPLDRLWGGAMWLWKNQKHTPTIRRDAQKTINDENENAVERGAWAEILLEKLKFDENGECTSSEIFKSILGVCPADFTDEKTRKLGQILNSIQFESLGVKQAWRKHNKKSVRVWIGCKI
jgi:predicted P-loop ATPase